jgi:hydroxymethylbilane synthase
MTPAIRIATRKSALAMWQARHVQDRLEKTHPGIAVTLVPIVTRGDRIIDRPLAEIGGKGLFLKELERALLDGDADIAVHSMKDVPAEMTGGLALDVVLPRATPFDAWVSRQGTSFTETEPGSKVGTSSLRRQCQLLASRPDLEVADLRGNVDTRLRKLDAGEYDAIILACAGLERLGLQDRITHALTPPEWLPAATQGIIGLQSRAGDTKTRELLTMLNDPGALVQSEAERAVAKILEGNCQVPLAVYAVLDHGELSVNAMVGTPDGKRIIRAGGKGSSHDAGDLGRTVADQLLQQGAAEIIANLKQN